MPHRTAPWPHAPEGGPAAQVTPTRTPSGKVRWFATLTLRASAAYEANVAAVAPLVEARLGSPVLADRTRAGVRPGSLQLTPFASARDRWRRASGRRLPGSRALLVTDVRDCFGSIRPAAVAHALARDGASNDAVGRVVGCLETFQDHGVRGLPIGPPASAVLANAVLAALDDSIQRDGVRHLRWVDDVVAFAETRRLAERTLDDLRGAAADIGLTLHDAKTRIVDDPCEARAILGLTISPGASEGMA